MTLVIVATLLFLVVLLPGFATYTLRQRRVRTLLQVEVEQLRNEAAQSQVVLRERTELDSVKDEFISTVSHELRTPLTSIRGALGLLSAGLMGTVDERAANLLRIASSNTDRLVRLINDILDLERMSSGSAPLQLRSCSVRDLITQSVDTMTAMAAEARVTLVVAPEVGSSMPTCEVDPDRLQQVFTNLLSNAIKFSPPGAAVRIRAESRGGELTVTVRDGGRGVPQTKLESIFERFQQVEPSDARQKGGTGLGLAICRSIVQQHGGQIWAERNDARGTAEPGTTFCIRLSGMGAPVLPAPAVTQRSGAILIVDDDAGARQGVAEHLRSHGYQVLESESGPSALSVAAKRNPAAILLDLYMPGLTGWETVEQLKANPVTASIPVVILSVLSPPMRQGNIGALVGHTEGWIQKPFSPTLLMAELSRILHRGEDPGRILLFESRSGLSEAVIASLSRLPGGSRVDVQIIRDAQEAMDFCQKQVPEALILDMAMPDSSCFTLVSWLRRQPSLCMLPLLIYSEREITPEEMDQLRLGPTHFLTNARIQPEEVESMVFAMVPHMHFPFRDQPSA